MDTFGNIQEAFRAYGVRDLPGLASPRVSPWSIPLDFSTNIAAAASGQAAANNENGYVFIVQSLNIVVFNPTAAGNVVANTPAYTDAANGVGAATGNSGSTNTWMALSMFSLNLRTATNQWFANPVRANLICGDARRPGYRLLGYAVAPGQTILATLANGSGQTVQAQLLLDGYRIAV